MQFIDRILDGQIAEIIKDQERRARRSAQRDIKRDRREARAMKRATATH